MHTEKFSREGGGKLGPHKRMTLAIMIIAYIYTSSICLLRFALVNFEEILDKIIVGFNSK